MLVKVPNTRQAIECVQNGSKVTIATTSILPMDTRVPIEAPTVKLPTSSEDVISKEDAADAINRAKETYKACKKLVDIFAT